MNLVRHAAVSGAFYPSDPTILAGDVTRFLDSAETSPAEEGAPAPKAVIAPHAGYIYSGATAARVFSRLRAGRRDIRRVILFGPSHRVAFPGLAVSSAEYFETPLGHVPLDRRAIAGLLRLRGVVTLDAAHAQEHSLEVQLPFLQTVLDDFALVPVVVGDASPELVAAAMEILWGGPETLMVVSSDLSHYHDYERARRMDLETSRAIERLDLGSIGYDQACGRIPIAGLLLEARRHGLAAQTVELCNSGDTAGPRDRVVGYGGWIFRPEGAAAGFADETTAGALLRKHAPSMLALARQSISARLNGQTAPRPQDLPPLLNTPGACFVTLKLRGELRGCIGSAVAWRPLADDILDNAAAAAFRDPRFVPLTSAEWTDVDLSLSILTPPEPMSFTDEAALLAQMRPGVDGLIIEDGTHRALFLPSVWEMLPTPSQFLGQLKRKAGLTETHWSPTFAARRFQTVEFHD